MKYLTLIFLVITLTCPLFSQVVINDPYFSKQWYLHMDGSESTRADIRAVEAWDRTLGNSSQKIADIEGPDGGFPSTFHEDLLNRVTLHGSNFSGEHSTNVAGILVANHNTIGIAGINKFAQLHSYIYSDTDDWPHKVHDARVDGNNIINLSQGLYESLDEVGVELAKSYNDGIINVVSVGNDNRNMSYPSIYSSVIAVGASTKYNAKSPFSNTGPQIEFLAPGGSNNDPTNEDNIYTTSLSGSYAYVTGTSYSAPLVSGAASLLMAYKPELTNDDVKNILINSCDKLEEMGSNNFTNRCGYGRINLEKAMTLLEENNLDNTLTVSGGSIYSTSSYEVLGIYGVTGLADDEYIVRRYEVRVNAPFPRAYSNHYAWGRGSNSTGWAYESPNFGKTYCEIVPGTLQEDEVTLKSYVYKLYNGLGQSLGWYPCSPENVVFAYSVLGKAAPLFATVTGTTSLQSGSQGTWTASVSGGIPPYDYNWQYYLECDNAALESDVIILAAPCGNWLTASGNSNTLTRGFNQNFRIRCVVKDSRNVSATSNVVRVNVFGGSLSKENTAEINTLSMPLNDSLIANYPNPFNPTTKIKFSIKNDGWVTLKVYDILGKEVTTLFNGNKKAGFYSVNFDASRLASGIYFYSLQTKDFRDTKKMLLTK